MKNTKYLFYALCAVAAAVSCNKVAVIEDNVNTEEPVLQTYTCILADDTKVSIDNAGKTKWEVGDKIFFHGQYGSDATSHTDSFTTVTLTADDISTDGKTATFTMPALTPYVRTDVSVNSTLYAQYPASAVESTYYAYYYCKFNDTNKPLMAAYNDGNTFYFYNLCAVISFKVTGDYDSYIFTGNSGETVGYDSFQVKVTDYEQNFKHTLGTALTSISGPVTSDGSTLNYVCIPYRASLTSGFKLQLLKEGNIIKEAKSVKPLTLQRAEYTALGDITSHLKNYTPQTHVSTLSSDKDLSVPDGKANCYVVVKSNDNAGTVFKFPAKKGNSDVAVENIASVEILWESWNNDATVTSNSIIAEVDYDANWIYFKTPAAENFHIGNAVIAAKNMGGNVLWSWHIWVPETELSSGTYGGISSVNMMDRNLGALRVASAATEDIQAAGLLYQWGRKDPFPNKKAHTSSDNDLAYHATLSAISSNFSTYSGLIELGYSIKNPMVFAAIADGNTDWVTTSDDTFWGATKTMYDPCPPGYRVPLQSECDLFNESKVTTFSGFSYNASTQSVTIGESGNATVFPTGMLYQNGRYDEPLNKLLIWSATSNSDHIRAIGMYIKVTGASVSAYKRSKANAGSLRCVVE